MPVPRGGLPAGPRHPVSVRGGAPVPGLPERPLEHPGVEGQVDGRGRRWWWWWWWGLPQSRTGKA